MIYKYETHLHTRETSACATASGRAQAERYKELGYDGIIVTDHFFNGNCLPEIRECDDWKRKVDMFCRGFDAAKAEGDRIGLKVFFGFEYCYRGADMLIYPTAIGYESSDTPEEQQRQRMAWQTVQRGHAVANGLPVITVNRVGYEPDPSGQTNGIQFWGTSFVAGPQGELIYEASTDEEESIIVEIDLDHSEQVRRWWPFLRDRRIDAYKDITSRFID